MRLLKSVRDLCSDYKIKLIINDNVRVAKQLNCGVHLGKDDLSLKQARREMGEKAIIGVSCYNSALNAKKFAELGASYVALGCFFPSITKTRRNKKCSGVELQKLNGKLKVPIVAIGGITNTNAKTIIQYGADLVVSSYIYDSDSPYEKIKCLQSVVSEAK